MSWEDWLSREERKQLRADNPRLPLEEIAIDATRRPGYRHRCKRLGVVVRFYADYVAQDFLKIGHVIPSEAREELYVPPGKEEEFAALVVEAMLPREGDVSVAEPPAKRGVGRPEESAIPIPEPTLLWVLERIHRKGKSARWIAKNTSDRKAGLTFVNREKAGVIAKWVKNHPERARRAVSGRKIPRDFPATKGGYLLPKP